MACKHTTSLSFRHIFRICLLDWTKRNPIPYIRRGRLSWVHNLLLPIEAIWSLYWLWLVWPDVLMLTWRGLLPLTWCSHCCWNYPFLCYSILGEVDEEYLPSKFVCSSLFSEKLSCLAYLTLKMTIYKLHFYLSSIRKVFFFFFLISSKSNFVS